MKIIEVLVLGAAQVLVCGTERDAKKITDSEIRDFVIKRRETVPNVLPVICYPSDRKSKGEKKREKSAKHKRGWK